MAVYAPPVDQLLRLQWKESYWERWPDYLAMGFEERHVPELIRLATDDDLLAGSDESDAIWAPLHAWRVLALLRAVDAVRPLMELAGQKDLDPFDMALDELPRILPRMGPAILPEVRPYLERRDLGFSVRTMATDIISNVGKEWPESRAACVEILTKQMEQAAEEDPGLNGMVLWGLLELKAVEAAPAIKRACEGGYVDESLAGGWPEAEYELGLTTVKPPARRFHPFGPIDPIGLLPATGTGHTPKARAKDRSKARRKQSQQSRKRNRKKK